MANTESERILVSGASGQLGREFRALAAESEGIAWHFHDRTQLDISDPASVKRAFARVRPTVCINCAAYTAVDRAEEEPEIARRINVEAVNFLSSACRDHDSFLVHFSSDYVYHNGLDRPLREEDPTRPAGVYARTKRAGEREALRHDQSLVIRTSWVYAPFGKNFVRSMRRMAATRPELRVVNDQIGSPTYARDLARAVLAALARKEQARGIFNFSNEGVCSWYDFALAIVEESGLDCPVRPIPSKDFPTAAPRPHYSVLDRSRWKAVNPEPIRHWRVALRHCLGRIQPEG